MRQGVSLIERVDFHGWRDCWRMDNGLVELLAVSEVGPRVLAFSLKGQPSPFKLERPQLGLSGGRGWRLYGGHRLWNAPERKGLCTLPDNGPVAVEVHGQTLTLLQPPEAKTGIQKEIEITLLPGRPAARVTHRLRNRSAKPQVFAPWALTVVEPGGLAVLPLAPRGEHPRDLSPTSQVVLWPYTDFSDDRLGFTGRFVTMGTDPRRGFAQKVGVQSTEGWMAYAWKGQLFVKRTEHKAGATYPDRGCTHQVFTHSSMLELETLAPLTLVMPGAAAEHAETWWLFGKTPALKGARDIEARVLPKLKLTRP